jgi:ribonucleoside-diphosphate reductase alpha chain
MERFDLAHVDPSESGFDALGKGEDEGKPTNLAPASRYVSRGLTRNRTDKLSVVSGGGASASEASSPSPLVGEGRGGGSNVTAIGATALHTEPEAKLSPTQKLEFRAEAIPDAKALAKEKRLEAKAKGYEGDPCGECQNYTLVRNGTCMKCDTCGSTTGCS